MTDKKTAANPQLSLVYNNKSIAVLSLQLRTFSIIFALFVFLCYFK